MDVIVEDLPKNDPPAKPAEQTDRVEHLSVTRMFNIDIPTKEEDGKLREIWEHARGLSRTGEIMDVIWQIKHLEQTLGAPRLGESRLDKLYRYAKLRRQQKMVEEELKDVSLSAGV